MKKKVLAFITRKSGNNTELLVFDQRGHPEAGTQIPAGTVEDNEAVETALIREIFEESGLDLLHSGKFLGEFHFTYEDKQELRHIFHVSVDIPLKDEWEHTVGGDGIDKGMVFKYYWVPLSSAHEKLCHYQNAYLSLI